MPETLTATAIVSTQTPERYAKQLASHLGRRSRVYLEPEGTRISLPGVGDCLLQTSGDKLLLTANAGTSDGLDRMMDVVGSHLERFGQRNELNVSWQRPG